MSRVSVGAPNWGPLLNSDISQVEAKADSALEQVESLSDQLGGIPKLLLIDYTINPTATIESLDPAADTLIVMRSQGVTLNWDFRNLSALPAGWARRGISSETFSSSGMAASLTSGQGWYYDLPSTPNEMVVTGKVVSGAAVMSGIGAASKSTGNGRMACWYTSSQGFYNLPFINYSYGGPNVTSDVSTPYWPVFMRFSKSVSGESKTFKSNDGVAYAGALSAPDANALDRIWVGSVIGNDPTFKIESLSVFYGNKGGVLGLWDGSALLSF